MPPNNIPKDRTGMANCREAAAHLAISVASLYRRMSDKTIPFKKIGRSRRISWPWLVAFTTLTPKNDP